MAEALHRFDAATNKWIKVANITQIVVQGGGGATEPIIFEINVTAANTKLTLSIGRPYAIRISWGDGSVHNDTKKGDNIEKVSNIYQPGVYTVTIEGACVSFKIDHYWQTNKIISKIISFGSVATYLSGFMTYESTISEIQQGVMPSKNYRLISLSEAFNGCSSLTTLPADLIADSYIYNTRHMFRNCTGLTSLPPFLFSGVLLVSNDNMFNGCTSLTSLPDDLFNGCLGLSAGGDSMFNNTNLETISPYIFRGFLGTNVGSMFNGCTKLTSIPDDLFDNTNITHVDYMFNGCTKLTSIPANLFDNTNIINVNQMFNGCINITGPVPELWNNPQFKSYFSCFRGCTKASNYASIPASWK